MDAVNTCKTDSFGFCLKCVFPLTAVGNSKTVRHFQIVNVRRQSEFRGAKLNHSYPKCAVLLIRTPWKKSPWNRHRIAVKLAQFSTKRHIFQAHFPHRFAAFQPISSELIGTYQSEHWASLQARIPITPAELKRINSLSFPCPQFRCPHPPRESDIPRSLRRC